MKPPYFLTAYGLACKHGFRGSEEEWLNSLTAFYLAQQAGYQGTANEWLSLLNDPVPDITIGEVTTLDGGSNAIVTITGDRLHPVLNFGIPRGLGMADALALVGGTMKGIINMNGFGIIGLADPKEEGDAVHKKYADAIRKVADAALPNSGGEMKGIINMNGFRVTKLADPLEDGDAVPKRLAILCTGGKMTGELEVLAPTQSSHAANKEYVDTRKVTANLTAAGWSDAAPYTQAVNIEGLTDEKYARVYPAWPFSLEEKQALSEETIKVRSCERSGNAMTFQCWEEKPIMDIPIVVEVYV